MWIADELRDLVGFGKEFEPLQMEDDILGQLGEPRLLDCVAFLSAFVTLVVPYLLLLEEIFQALFQCLRPGYC